MNACQEEGPSSMLSGSDDFSVDGCSSPEAPIIPDVSSFMQLHEIHSCLLARMAALRRETRELKAQIKQKERKQVDFRVQMNNHFESVAHQKLLLSTRVEGLENERRQLRAMDDQQMAEERALRPRIDEALADHAATDARIQVLMDRLVTLLSSASGASMETMVAQIIEEFQCSLSNLDDKIQSDKVRLEEARRENHMFAVRLSDEQSETKRLHDKLCSLQSRLYHGRFHREPLQPRVADAAGDSLSAAAASKMPTQGASASNSVAAAPPAISGPSVTVGMEAQAASNAFSMDRAAGRSHRLEPTAADGSAGPTALAHDSIGEHERTSSERSEGGVISDRETNALEERLRGVLDTISFQEPVVRIRSGLYKFGADLAYLRRTQEGGVFAQHVPDGAAMSTCAADWRHVEDFIRDLSSKHRRALDKRWATAEDPCPHQALSRRKSEDCSQASSEVTSAAHSPTLSSHTARQGQVAAGDDAAGWAGGGTASPSELATTKSTPPEAPGASEVVSSNNSPKPQKATAGDDAAGREHPQAEVMLSSPQGQGSGTERGHGGDAAAGGWHRSNAPKNGGSATVGVGGGNGGLPAKKTPSAHRFLELPAPLEGITSAPERMPNHVAPAGVASDTQPGINTDNSTNPLGANGGKNTAQASSNPPPSSLAHQSSGVTNAASRAPSVPASPPPGARSLGNIGSVAGMLSPTRLGAKAAGAYGPASPARIPSRAKAAGTASPQRATGAAAMRIAAVGGTAAQTSQMRAQPPPALTPRQLNLGSFAPPFRTPTVPISAPPTTAVPRSHSPNPTGAVPRSHSPNSLQVGGTTVEPIPGGSFTAPAGKRVVAVHSGGGSFELPIGGGLAAVTRSQSNSPSHRQKSPQPLLRNAIPSRVLRTSAWR